MSKAFQNIKIKWIKWLKEEKRFSDNTLLSYKRDLLQWENFIDVRLDPSINDLRSFLIFLYEYFYYRAEPSMNTYLLVHHDFSHYN